MPNWCQNQFSVKSPDEETLNKFLESVKGKDKEENPLPLDFEKILPTPPELLGRTASALRENRSDEDKRLAEKYGTPDWYHWRLENWGTKWNLCSDTDLDVVGNEAFFRFDSAWTPPCYVLDHLFTLWPTLEAELLYCEFGCDFAGKRFWRKGILYGEVDYRNIIVPPARDIVEREMNIDVREWTGENDES